MPELIGFTDMELGVGEQLLGCAVAGAALGAVLPHPLTSSRLARSAEGAVVASFLGLMFLLGAGRLGEADRSPMTLAVSGLGLLLYCAAVHAVGRAALGWRADDRENSGS